MLNLKVDIPVEAAIPVIAVFTIFMLYCLFDIWRTPSVRHLPKLVWALIVLAGGLLGGIAYLVVGRGQR